MILALDIASVTGVAYGPKGGTPRGWIEDFGKGSHPSRFFWAQQFLARFLRDHPSPDVILYEAPWMNKRRDNLKKLALLNGLITAMQIAAHSAGVPMRGVSVQAINRAFLGCQPPAGMRKAAIMTRCRQIGWDVTAQDAADAMALWATEGL